MGTQSRLSGRIRISPPLNAKEIRELSKFTVGVPSGNMVLTIPVSRSEEETDEGVLVRWSADAIVPAHEECNARDIETEIETIRDAVMHAHTLDGFIRGVTETGRLWQVRCSTGDDFERYADFETPVVLWPEDYAKVMHGISEHASETAIETAASILQRLKKEGESGDPEEEIRW